MRRNADLRNAGWGPLRWPSERRWIREAEALVEHELARWIDPPGPANPGSDESDDGEDEEREEHETGRAERS